MEQEIDLLLEKACVTPEGRFKATFIMAELQKLAPAFQDETTREAAEEALTKWSDLGGDPLRKGMAMAWLARARSALMPQVADALKGATNGVNAVRRAAGAVRAGAQAAVGNVKATAERVQGAVGDVGAAAGEKLANSKLNAGRMAQIRQMGGDQARAAMAERLAPQGHAAPFFEHESAPADRLDTMNMQPNAHSEQLASAFRQGADSAAQAHAAAAAKVGRVAARHAFKAGAMLGATGVGVAAAGTIAGRLSQKEHDERVAAGHHSHDHKIGVAKAAEADELEKGIVGKVLRGAALEAGHQLDGAIRKTSFKTLGAIGGAAAAGVAVNRAVVAPHVQRMAELNAPKQPKTPKVPGAV